MNRCLTPKSDLPPQLRGFVGAREIMQSTDPALFEKQLDLSQLEVVITPEEMASPAVQAMMDGDVIGVAGRAPDGRWVVMLDHWLRLNFSKYVLKLCGPERFLPDFLNRGNKHN